MGPACKKFPHVKQMKEDPSTANFRINFWASEEKKNGNKFEKRKITKFEVKRYLIKLTDALVRIQDLFETGFLTAVKDWFAEPPITA